MYYYYYCVIMLLFLNYILALVIGKRLVSWADPLSPEGRA